ncbi:MAG: DNA-directed RNA polymerase subunit H [Desulfurococcales archaeon]|nr:DNA-directed RNA polymerase subunit H [Desulfurococcales archaeon]
MTPSKVRVKKKILSHKLVPKHELLSVEEAAKVLKEYNVKPYQLPHISVNDPVVRLLNGHPGNIIRITRKSPTAGESVVYRIVVAY